LGDQAHHREGADALAAARLSDQRQRLAGINAVSDAINRFDDPSVGVEARLQVVDLEQTSQQRTLEDNLA